MLKTFLFSSFFVSSDFTTKTYAWNSSLRGTFRAAVCGETFLQHIVDFMGSLWLAVVKLAIKLFVIKLSVDQAMTSVQGRFFEIFLFQTAVSTN